MILVDEQRSFLRENLRKIGAFIGVDGLDAYVRDIEGRTELLREIEDKVAPIDFFRTKHWDSVLRFGLYRLTQFAVTRALAAENVIETGVLHGLLSIFVLEAMADWGRGTLYSIDLPSTFDDGPSNVDGFTDTLPPELGPGWAIPDRLTPFWNLRIGKSVDMLPDIFAESPTIDLFVHDSDHTWRTMTAEFEAIWPCLRPGGVMIADNIDCNTAFFDFAIKLGKVPFVAPVDPDHHTLGLSGIRFGVLQK